MNIIVDRCRQGEGQGGGPTPSPSPDGDGNWLFYLFMVGVYVLDLVTKVVVRARMSEGSEIQLLPFFSLVHVKNTGIAFGMFQERNVLFIGLGFGIVAAILFYAVRLLRTDRFSALVLAAVVGGALGNLTDRVCFGQVTDFLDFYWGPHHWPAFNVADSTICVGAALLLWKSMRSVR